MSLHPRSRPGYQYVPPPCFSWVRAFVFAFLRPEESISKWVLLDTNADGIDLLRPSLWKASQVLCFWLSLQQEQNYSLLSLNHYVSLGRNHLRKTQEETIKVEGSKGNCGSPPLYFQVPFDIPGVTAPSTLVPAAHSLLCSFRLSLDNTEVELHSLFVRTKTLKENVQRDRELCQQMEDFLQVSYSSQSLWSPQWPCEATYVCRALFVEAVGSHSCFPP